MGNWAFQNAPLIGIFKRRVTVAIGKHNFEGREQNRNQHSPVDSSYSQVFVALSKNATEIVNKLLKVQQDVQKGGRGRKILENGIQA